MHSSRSTAASRHPEEVPSDPAAVAISRAFHRLTKLETALDYVIQRVVALEEAPGAAEATRKIAAAPRRTL